MRVDENVFGKVVFMARRNLEGLVCGEVVSSGRVVFDLGGDCLVEVVDDDLTVSVSYLLGGVPHCVYGPAVVVYSSGGYKLCEEFWVGGVRHRVGGAAVVRWDWAGCLLGESYWVSGCLHREDGPAFRLFAPDGAVLIERFYRGGKLQGSTGKGH